MFEETLKLLEEGRILQEASGLRIPPALWGKDHYSTLTYIETRCVESINGVGSPKIRQIQTNFNRHPYFDNSHPAIGQHIDGADYPIRLKDGIELAGPLYDEWDVLDDLERWGLIENVGTGFQRVYRFLDEGNRIVGQLRAHKTRGGNYADFVPDPPVNEEPVGEVQVVSDEEMEEWENTQ